MCNIVVMDQEITEERIDSLKSELDSYGKEILNLISATYASHPSGGKYDLKHSPQQMLPLLYEEVLDLVRQSQENTAFFEKHKEKITHCNSLITALNNICSIVDKIVLCEESLQSLALTKCAGTLSDIESLLSESAQGIPSSDIHRVLQKEYRLVRCRLMNKVKRLIHDCIHVEMGKIYVVHTLQGYIRSEDKVYDNAIELSDLFKVLQDIKADDEVVRSILKEIWQLVVRPMWKEKKAFSPHITVHNSSSTSSSSDQKAEFIIGSMTRGGDLVHHDGQTDQSGKYVDVLVCTLSFFYPF